MRVPAYVPNDTILNFTLFTQMCLQWKRVLISINELANRNAASNKKDRAARLINNNCLKKIEYALICKQCRQCLNQPPGDHLMASKCDQR